MTRLHKIIISLKYRPDRLHPDAGCAVIAQGFEKTLWS
ncbi:hypothetical protein MNBD_ALPHA11-2391 [hydrothermal vent metagenome]|uniref:Uncharacterized protein n=1 Tax=hydrothermal vent metagenome TaxID=652676 RepID=A0A3B0U1Z4_9ZZZZ